MRLFGRLLQMAALVFLPLTILFELNGVIRTGPMLTMMVGSLAMFYLGRLIEGYARG